VDGAWKIESGAGHFSASPVSPSPIAAEPCADFFSSVSNAPLSISQSGKTLVVTLSGEPKPPPARSKGKSIKAQFSGLGADKDKSEAAQCGDGLTLTATLDPQAEPRTLSGRLSVEGCASCAPVEFRAVRQPRACRGHALMPNLFILVLQVAVVLTACRLTGALFRKFNQPRVVGEMFAGIMLGPSFLGWIAPHFSAYLFPASSLGFLNALSQIGVIIFMFLVGLNINPKELQKEGHAAVLSSHVSITAPFVLAAFLALYLYPRLSDDSVAFSSFALFMGAAMSITAFPVLARILQERKMMHTRLGTVAIACAAVDDVTGWIILAYIVVLIRAAHSPTSIWVTLGGIVVFAIVMIYGVQRLMQGVFLKAYQKWGHLSENRMAFMMLLVLASALCTERLGIHLLFGAFLMGAIMPKEPEIRPLRARPL
jgi:Kef-type K+ transport system membrane component KefB